MASTYGYDRLTKATEELAAMQGVGGLDFKETVTPWYRTAQQVLDNRPEEFMRWQQENPEMAIRFHAHAANNSEGSKTFTPEQHQQMAHALGVGYGQSMGLGDDMKENGRMLATDYKTFKDVNREWGLGDFWKIGTMQTLDKGFGAFIDNLDFKDIAMMAAPFIAGPLIGPALAGMGLSPAAQAALAPALMQGLQGGDLKDMVLAGGEGWAKQYLPGIIKDMDWGSELPGGDFQLPDWMKDIGEGAEEIYGELKGWGDDLLAKLPGDFQTPDWGGGDWGDLFGDPGELFGDIGDIFGGGKDILDSLFGGGEVPQGAPAQAIAAMMPERETTPLAKLNAMPGAPGIIPMQPLLDPMGMMKT